MRRFRTNRGVAVWPVFFALACQLSFTFGHIHIGKFGTGLAAQAVCKTGGAAADAPAPRKRE